MKIDRIRMDIDKKLAGVIPSVQWDSNTRFLHINILNGAKAFDLTGCSVKVAGLKPDGTSFLNNVKIINAKEGFIEVVLTEQMNAAAGSVRCDIKIYNSKGVLSTQPFIIDVEPSVTTKAIVSSNEFQTLTEMLNTVGDLDKKFDSLTSEAVAKATEKEIQKQIANGGMANLAISDGSLEGKKLKNSTITSEKIKDMCITGGKLGKGTLRLLGGATSIINVFPTLEITAGKFISWTSGQALDNDIYFCSLEYIDVIPGTLIEFSHGVKGAFYNIDNIFVKGIDLPTNEGKVSVLVPTNAVKMRMSSLVRYQTNFSIWLEKAELTSTYKIPKVLDGKRLELEDGFVTSNHLADNAITRDKCDNTIVKYKRGKNLFNLNTAIMDKFVNWGTGALQGNSSYITSGLIEIIPNKRINQTHNTHYAFYTATEAFVSGNRDSQTPDPLIAPSNAKYIRVSMKKELVNEYMLVIDAECGEYEPFGYIVDNIVDGHKVYFPTKTGDADKFKQSRFYGKKVSWFGTSITQGYEWCRLVNQKFNFDATNNGVGGTAICKENENSSMCTRNRMLGKYNNVTDPNTGATTLGGVPIPKDVEVIFLEGGANDWARNWAIGDKKFTPSPNDQTFGGACHLMFKNLTELFPDAEIIIVGAPFGKLKNRTAFTNKYGVLNNQNLQTVEYGDILLDTGGKWGAHGFNLGRVMQVHDNNIEELIPDGLHLNTKEVQERAANAVINYLLQQG